MSPSLAHCVAPCLGLVAHCNHLGNCTIPVWDWLFLGPAACPYFGDLRHGLMVCCPLQPLWGPAAFYLNHNRWTVCWKWIHIYYRKGNTTLKNVLRTRPVGSSFWPRFQRTVVFLLSLSVTSTSKVQIHLSIISHDVFLSTQHCSRHPLNTASLLPTASLWLWSSPSTEFNKTTYGRLSYWRLQVEGELEGMEGLHLLWQEKPDLDSRLDVEWVYVVYVLVS